MEGMVGEGVLSIAHSTATTKPHFVPRKVRTMRPIKMGVQVVQYVAPYEMWGVDWIGPITPVCSVTRAAYVLPAVDYFSRFTWAKAYQQHTKLEVWDMYENHITPILGWSRGVFLDNDPYFVNVPVK